MKSRIQSRTRSLFGATSSSSSGQEFNNTSAIRTPIRAFFILNIFYIMLNGMLLNIFTPLLFQYGQSPLQSSFSPPSDESSCTLSEGFNSSNSLLDVIILIPNQKTKPKKAAISKIINRSKSRPAAVRLDIPEDTITTEINQL